MSNSPASRKARYVVYPALIASWTFFAMMGYYASGVWEGGLTYFRVGCILFTLIAMCLLVLGMVRRSWWLAFAGTLILLPVLLCGSLIGQGVDEIGIREVPLKFTVVDADTRAPVPNARVRVLEGDPKALELARGQAEGRTDAEGKVALVPDLIFTATSVPFRRGGSIRFWGKVLDIIAEDYEPLSTPMEVVTGYGQPLHAPPAPPFVVIMKRKPRLH